ncbi:MAG TPA: hypothetical protein VK866_09060 [Acidimicrobiales bacterium]|nr:hypothetical protein [Acidimicrobiales bacterium]
MAVGCYPGSFNPPTIAHLAIARAAIDQHHLERLDLVVSRQALGKDAVDRPRLEDRMDVLRAVARSHPGIDVRLTDARLVADIAEGYDLVVVGADKWHQLHDVAFYGGSAAARDAALARLPVVAVAPRPPDEAPAELVLALPDDHAEVSSTAVRESAAHHWMAPEAADFAERTGAWVDPERYELWLATSAWIPRGIHAEGSPE